MFYTLGYFLNDSNTKPGIDPDPKPEPDSTVAITVKTPVVITYEINKAIAETQLVATLSWE